LRERCSRNIRPGDTVVWKTEDGSASAIVQTVNAKARTAEIRPSTTDAVERVPLLELDAYGNDSTGAASNNFDSLGVRRSDFVFVHAEGTNNGAEKGRVPRIGEMPEWTKDNSDTAGWREGMRTKGMELAQSREGLPPRTHTIVKKSERGDASCNWLGEVTDVSMILLNWNMPLTRCHAQLRLDGTVEVNLVDGTISVLPLERLTKLYDGMDQLDDLWGDEVFTESGSEFTDEIMEIISEDPLLPGEVDGGEWEDVDDDMEVEKDWSDDGEGEAHNVPPTPVPVSGEATPQPPVPASPPTAGPATTDVPPVSDQQLTASTSSSVSDAPFERFEVLSSAPHDHAFLSTNPAQPSKNFMTRLTKEYRVLSSSLPG
jgi:ubiquitin-conjugating enzyme E2 O